ncbi:hypothetical protein [Ottowia testudinis]|uniref:DUF4124 domain-containing protein n=1 Tax=Ottowia testudinis TaxID=2816950 RepID=A0A975H465_9BURK|nr:hypothetical protein [Ottowia testudinis]QTD46578.1 hypothetical protein J1M35_06795 [Ottowia testudinis]
MTRTILTLRLTMFAALAAVSGQAVAACYIVFDGAGQVVHQADGPPTSAAQAVTVPQGGRVVLNGERCTGGVMVAEQLTSAPEPAPLPTKVQPAATAGTPYALAGRDIDAAGPVNAQQMRQRSPEASGIMADAPAARARRRDTETVITEWADGRVDVERRALLPRY